VRTLVAARAENLDWYNNTAFNNLCLVTNAATFVLYVFAEFYFFRREHYIINHLDEKRDRPYDNLRAELRELDAARGIGLPWETKLSVVTKLSTFHTNAYLIARALLASLIVNLAINCKLLFTDSYYSERTTTTLATNMLLVSSKVAGYVMAAKESAEADLSISMYSSTRVSYNVIESDYKVRCAAEIAAAKAEWEAGGCVGREEHVAALEAKSIASKSGGASKAGSKSGSKKSGKSGDVELADVEAGRSHHHHRSRDGDKRSRSKERGSSGGGGGERHGGERSRDRGRDRDRRGGSGGERDHGERRERRDRH
jgi:hypothetical protein